MIAMTQNMDGAHLHLIPCYSIEVGQDLKSRMLFRSDVSDKYRRTTFGNDNCFKMLDFLTNCQKFPRPTKELSSGGLFSNRVFFD